MAWSPAARQAAIEARRRKRKLPSSDYGVTTRSSYASELRHARKQMSTMKPGKQRNKAVRAQAKHIIRIGG